MAENQARDSRERNVAHNGGAHSRTRATSRNRFEFDEQASVGRRSLDRVGQFYLESAKDEPDWQPRD